MMSMFLFTHENQGIDAMLRKVALLALATVLPLAGIQMGMHVVPPIGLLAYFAGVAANGRLARRQAPAPARGH